MTINNPRYQILIFNVVKCSVNLLKKIDDITTEEFQKGGERKEREALRKALREFEKAQMQILNDKFGLLNLSEVTYD